MSRIRVLIFIDDERPVLSPQRLKDVEPTLQIRHTRFIVSSKGECARNVMISPWLIAKAVQCGNHRCGIIKANHVRAAGQQQVCRKVLDVSKIMHAFMRFELCQNVLACLMHPQQVQQHPRLQSRAHANFVNPL